MNLRTVKWAQCDKPNTENCKNCSSKCAYQENIPEHIKEPTGPGHSRNEKNLGYKTESNYCYQHNTCKLKSSSSIAVLQLKGWRHV